MLPRLPSAVLETRAGFRSRLAAWYCQGSCQLVCRLLWDVETKCLDRVRLLTSHLGVGYDRTVFAYLCGRGEGARGQGMFVWGGQVRGWDQVGRPDLGTWVTLTRGPWDVPFPPCRARLTASCLSSVGR